MKPLYRAALVAIMLPGCTLKANTQLTRQRPPVQINDPQLVVEEKEDVPPTAERIGTLRLRDTGFSVLDCDYLAVLERAKAEMRKAGGNVLKITEHRLPTVMGSSCHRISADIYYLADLSPYEKQFAWTPTRRLQWRDYKSLPAIRSHAAAATYTELAWQAKPRRVGVKWVMDVEVRALFDCQRSWVNVQGMTDELLRHERGHFDIAQIYARKAENEFKTANIPAQEFTHLGQELMRKTSKEMELNDGEYDEQTTFGRNAAKQGEWEKQIQARLHNPQ